MEAAETQARMQAKTAEAAGITHSMRLWLTTHPARKKYIASSTCTHACVLIRLCHDPICLL